MMKDIFGTEVQVGDTVVTGSGYAQDLQPMMVRGFTSSSILLWQIGKYPDGTYFRQKYWLARTRAVIVIGSKSFEDAIETLEQNVHSSPMYDYKTYRKLCEEKEKEN